uniref:Uncharacterized protein n=1 Tax=Globodera pallida TaxID=36090 RepID=A0A183C0U4_GLOPA
MDPSEELRLLRAKIAQMESQQTINLPTSSSVGGKRRRIEGIEEQKELVDKTLEQMEEWKRVAKLELENKALRADLEHQKLLNAHNALQTKMEEYQNKQQQTIHALTEKLKELLRKIVESLKSVQTIVVTELEEQKLSNANKFAEMEQQNALKEKVVKGIYFWTNFLNKMR